MTFLWKIEKSLKPLTYTHTILKRVGARRFPSRAHPAQIDFATPLPPMEKPGSPRSISHVPCDRDALTASNAVK